MLLQNIENQCKANGMTIAALERKAGIPKATIGKWDKAKPAYDKVIKVARVLGCTVEELAGEE